MGGILLSGDVGRHLDCRTIFLEKKILELASATGREKSILAFVRHNTRPDDKVVIGEDLVNNLSTAKEADELITAAGGELLAISCACNRSPEDYYQVGNRRIPIVTIMKLPTKQYKQDDPEVAADIAAGNVVWKPKNNWDWLTVAQS